MKQGINRLLHMSGVRSVNHNLKAEDDAVAREYLRHDKLLYGDDMPGDDDMNVREIMTAGDFHHHEHFSPKGKSIGDYLGPFLMALALGGGLGGGGYLISKAIENAPASQPGDIAIDRNGDANGAE